MYRNSRLGIVASLLFVHLFFGPSHADAQVLLKPKGRNAAPLRTIALEARVAIDRMVASTQLTLTFQNETSQRIEADFLYTLPPDTQVTYFAYWYGTEKVVARVVEKERAAAIYSHITTRMRDPALVEMVGKNTFRARIFPVMPNADLKVEMHTVERLKTDAKGAIYRLPLRTEKGDALDSVKVEVTVRPDGSFTSVGNNIGLASEEVSEGTRLKLEATNYRPDKDLIVRLAREPAPVRAVLLSARSGGADGFFVLSLTPDRTMSAPTVSIQGVKIYSAVPSESKTLRAHSTLTVAGRYRGSGPAAATLSGVIDGRRVALSAPVSFSDEAIPNNPATQLWAAARISQLGEAPAHRSEVTALSRRFTIPSRYTSWLAIPAEERERYKHEKAMADVGLITQRIVDLMHRPSFNSRALDTLMKELDRVCVEAKIDPKQTLNWALSSEIERLAITILRGKRSSRPSSSTEWRSLVRICGMTGQSPEKALASQRAQMAEQRTYEIYQEAMRLAEKYAPHILHGTEKSAEARRMRAKIEENSRRSGHKASEVIREQILIHVRSTARRLAELEVKADPDPAEVARLRERLRRFSDAGGINGEEPLQDARSDILQQQALNVAQVVMKEIAAGRTNSEAARAARERLQGIAAKTGLSYQEALRNQIYHATWPASRTYIDAVMAGRSDAQQAQDAVSILNRAYQEAGLDPQAQLRVLADQYLYQPAYELVELRHKPRPDRRKLAELELQVERLAKAGGHDVTEYLASQERSYKDDPLLRLRDRIIEEYRKDQPDIAAVQRVRNGFIEENSRFRTRRYAEARAERLEVEAQLDRLDQAPPNPENGALKAVLVKRDDELRARMGDPLISIDAPADARQVVALMPGGEIKTLVYDPDRRRWGACFDIPVYAQEGEYAISVIVVRADGSRQSLTIKYHVDLTAPKGQGSARVAAGSSPVLRLEIKASEDTARVEAALPSGERVSLKRAPGSNRFFALAPHSGVNLSSMVTFILTDKAHNRTLLHVDLSEEQAGRPAR